MARAVTATFEITGWEEAAYDDPAEGARLSRVTVGKRFSGALEGTSVAQLLTAVAVGDENQAGYIGTEVVAGTLEGRSGTFVLQHGGSVGGPEMRQFGWVVPGSGTGGLRGLSGSVRFQHDAEGALVHLEYELPG